MGNWVKRGNLLIDKPNLDDTVQYWRSRNQEMIKVDLDHAETRFFDLMEIKTGGFSSENLTSVERSLEPISNNVWFYRRLFSGNPPGN